MITAVITTVTRPQSGVETRPVQANETAVRRDAPSAPQPQEPVPQGQALGPKARENLFRSASGPGADGLTEEQRAQVKELRARDAEVRRHEEAHARVGGQYAGQPSYTYQTGPDGKRYAIGGEVPIDVAPIPNDPAATIQKMDVVIAAALAPAEPSGQDRKVAALAARQRIEAMADQAAQRQQDFSGEKTGLAGLLSSVQPPVQGSVDKAA